jgi:pilus assembly protein CpaF
VAENVNRGLAARLARGDSGGCFFLSRPLDSLAVLCLYLTKEALVSKIYSVIPPMLRDARIQKLKAVLIDNIARMLQDVPARQQNRPAVRQWLTEALERMPGNVPAEIREQILDSALADLVGYGSAGVSAQGPRDQRDHGQRSSAVFMERGGELYETDVVFDDDAHLMRIIDRIVNRWVARSMLTIPLRRSPADGSRVHIIIPPVAIDGPHITIRKFLKTRMTMDDLIALDALTPYMAKLLEACVVARLNILVSGNTSSGEDDYSECPFRFYSRK